MRDDPDRREAADLAFPPSRAAALDRLAGFAPRAGRPYAELRNAVLPGHGAVSALSPYLRHRAITEAEFCAAVLDRNALPAARKAIEEMCWRSYFNGWLERRPAIWTDYLTGLGAARNRLATEAGLRRDWEAACEGRTGIAPFDDWAAELVRTGYLHNHARMWFASIWMHTLRLPWQLGADFFLRHLFDGDPASNTLSWRWVGGLHTRGTTYRARASNIARHTDGRFDEIALRAQLAEEAPPLDGPPHPDPEPVPEDAGWDPDLPTGLLLHEDDLHPDFLLARGLRPVAAAALIAPDGRSPLAVAPRVGAFTRALAADALARLAVEAQTPTEDIGAVRDWAAATGLRQIVAPHAPVGPLRSRLDRLEAVLDIPLIRPLRAWDATAWPHATRGYFKFRDSIPDLLEAIPQDAAP